MKNELDKAIDAAKTAFVPEHSDKRFTARVAEDGEEPVHDLTSLGKGITLVGGSKVVFDRKMAEKLLNLREMPGDRTLRSHGVEDLMAEMRQLTFRYEIVTIASAYCLETEIEYRINGQHCGWAVVELDGEVPAGRVMWLKYEAKTLEDARLLYSSYDRGLGRTKADVIRSQLSDSPGFEGLSPRAVDTLAQGFAFWHWDTKHKRLRNKGASVAYLLKTDFAGVRERVASFVSSSLNFSQCRFLRRVAVVGAMFATYDKAVGKADEFWKSVRDGVGLETTTDPRLILRNKLLQSKVSSDRPQLGKNTSDDMYAWCVNAWNAWRKGEARRALSGAVNGERPTAK